MKNPAIILAGLLVSLLLPNFKDMTKIGDLTILSEGPYHITPGGYKLKTLNIRCVCGKEFNALKDNVIKLHTKSCGCRKPPGYHGFRNTTLYRRWDSIIQRCCNASSAHYHNYGGRGITVCFQWRSFLKFKEWCESNGFNPDLELDRKRNNRGYYPLNCRWVTHSENNRNKRTNKYYTYNGETKTITEWSEITGINMKTLSWRLLNWPIEKALNEKVC